MDKGLLNLKKDFNLDDINSELKNKITKKYNEFNNVILNSASNYWKRKFLNNVDNRDETELKNDGKSIYLSEDKMNILNKSSIINNINESTNNSLLTNLYNKSSENNNFKESESSANEKFFNQEEYNLDKELLILLNENEKFSTIKKNFTFNDSLPSSLPTTYNDKRNWTEEEDKILMSYIKLYNSKNWKKISEILKTKTSQQCVYRYHKLINKHKEIKWNRCEDIQLMELIENYGYDWEILSKHLNKPADAIKERYYKKLDPNLKRCKFTEKEDLLIYKLHNKLGNKWFEIASYFPDRNSSMIKNRYYSYIRKQYQQKKQNFNVSEVSDTENCECSSSKLSSNNNNITPSIYKTHTNINIEDIPKEENGNKFNESNYFQNSNNTNQHYFPKTIQVNDDLGFNKNYNCVNYNECLDEYSKFNVCNTNNNVQYTNNFNQFLPYDNWSQIVNPFINNCFFENTRKNSNFYVNCPFTDEFAEDNSNSNKKLININPNFLNNDFNVDIFFENELERKNKNPSNHIHDLESTFRLISNGYNNQSNSMINIQVMNCFNKEEQEFLCNENITDKNKLYNNIYFEESSRIIQEIKMMYNTYNRNQNMISTNMEDNKYISNQNDHLDRLYENLLEFYIDKIGKINLALNNINFSNSLKFQLFVSINQKIQEKFNSLTYQISMINNERRKLVKDNDLNKVRLNLSNQADILVNLIMLTNLKIRLSKRYDEFLSCGK